MKWICFPCPWLYERRKKKRHGQSMRKRKRAHWLPIVAMA